MASRKIDYLITQARRESENESFSDDNGITDEEFIQYLNDGQHRLQSVILAQHPSVFVGEKIIDITRGTEEVELPSDSFLGNKVANVEYADVISNPEQYYYDLQLGSLKNRMSGVEGLPHYYIRRSGSLLLSPVPQQSGKLRLQYAQQIRELDKKRASVDSATLNTSDNTITDLTLNATTDSIDKTSLDEHNYLCVVDKFGNIEMANIPFDSVDDTTGIVSISPGFSYEDGESITAGAFIVGGQNTSTHPDFPRSVERYLIKYCVWKIMKRDSSTDYAEAQQELTAMESDITASYADLSDDITYIPNINDWNDWE